MLIRLLMIFLGCTQQLMARHLRGVRKCVVVENYAVEPAVVVVLPVAQQYDPSDHGEAYHGYREAIRVRVPAAHDGHSSRGLQCFNDASQGRNDYRVDRLSFESGIMTQHFSAQSSESGLNCVIEDTNDIWCQVEYAKSRS